MGRLKGIPDVLSPDILHLLASTGHGDEIVLADINFPTRSLCRGENRPQELRADGISVAALLQGILTLLPLDRYHDWQLAVMDMTESDKARLGTSRAPVVDEYVTLAETLDGAVPTVKFVERFAFYELTKRSVAIVQTGDVTPYANVILKRGVC